MSIIAQGELFSFQNENITKYKNRFCIWDACFVCDYVLLCVNQDVEAERERSCIKDDNHCHESLYIFLQLKTHSGTPESHLLLHYKYVILLSENLQK